MLRRIEYTLYRILSAYWNDFTNGSGDSAPLYINVSDGDISAIAQARKLPEVVLQQTPGLSFRFLAINWNDAPIDDIRARQAFSLALDRQTIARGVCLDACQATIHLVLEGMPGYHPDLADAAGRKGRDTLTPDLVAARCPKCLANLPTLINGWGQTILIRRISSACSG